MSDKPAKSASSSSSKDASIRYVNLYEADDKIYIRRITGFYQRLRRYTGIPLMLGFLLMPWLVIDGRPAMLFDLPERKFHVLWLTFWPQDAMYLAWLLVISAFLLFTVTVLVGRVWCGFTCPQTVWTQMFIWAEFVCEGDRNKRIKLDAQPWNFEKIWRKSAKQAIWIAISLVTSLTFIGYFTPIRELIVGFFTIDLGLATAFWVFFFLIATYMNAGFMREQFCKYICPYARFQAVMYDKDTLTVSYNPLRGEKRGPRKSGDDYKAQGMGDCIDCSWCVQVCPVDIDIRDGLQAECIDCGLCVDACNSVMDKMGYERGLISFTTEDAIHNGKTKVFRPRLLGYGLMLSIMMGLFVYSIATRVPVGVEAQRDRGVQMYRVAGDRIINVYTLKISNMDRQTHVYDVTIEGPHKFGIDGYRPIPVVEGEVLVVPVRVEVKKADLKKKKTEIRIRARARDNAEITAFHETTFIGP
ncbi:cytochrome c oxidase accessory protein CcoG [Cellvibrio japonicus]|uniref:Iron-sulfur cluster-binding protein n=1 Tax=Cellvibrio japonicus (strain Ueda107) TaxID=498211 RepID=B3PLL0_CELJU|nr:cytochrome c oxidase accessory protein CcoG [Cellvibrio japonicus]ACE85750.1 iron-sulfur cluster-binding protein [Cellvibrio japonicus Ueda107]QEI12998.1 cytochrome c oxidase accessory protein CcoG [Cellvibrio japonicus]QEI16572.1 cytochrome c oxidase accessory protein CcoG [Cellvibrio japonicus]QEI20150.1 cytochrome c oxidase accessory protein CcoG [Cellvibrio japonicus]